MSEPPSSLLPQAADPLLDIPPLTFEDLLLGAVLLVLSVLFASFARMAPRQGRSADEHARLAAAGRLAQYLTLLLAVAVLMPRIAGTPSARLAFALALFLVYSGLLAAAGVLVSRSPGAWLRPVGFVLGPWRRLMTPFVGLISARQERFEEPGNGADDDDERELALSEWLSESGLQGEELNLIANAARFREKSIGELMVPRPDVAWVSLADDPAEVLDEVRHGRRSRYPLCQDSPDQIVGYLHVKDLLQARAKLTPERLQALARPVAFVPETASALALLRRFQKERSHLAVVVDEFGGTAGIVTLEDLLEALVGEIQDEFDDEEEADVTLLAGGEVLVDGAVRLDDLERAYGFEFGDVEEETIGGYVFGRLAREVNTGDELEVSGARLRVEDVEGLRVTRVRVIPAPQAETVNA